MELQGLIHVDGQDEGQTRVVFRRNDRLLFSANILILGDLASSLGIKQP
jgi:hypothetical protein